MKRFAVLMLGFGLFLVALTAMSRRDDGSVTVSGNGNILYYNAPAAVQIDPGVLAIGYLTRQGGVRVQIRRENRDPDDVLVHDFASDIDTRSGPAADDHAAPAIHFSASEGVLRLAASYHSTDLFLYEAREPFTSWRLVHRQPGRLSYPRFLSDGDGAPLLVFREITQTASGIFHGNLNVASWNPFTMRTVKTGSATEFSRDVIYAGIPFVAAGKAFFGYTHFYGTDAFKGAYVGILEIATGNWRDIPILRDHDSASLMPSGIWSDGARVRVGVSVSTGFSAKQDEVVVVEVDLATAGETSIHRSGPLPVFYYNNVADFAADGSFLISRPGFLHPQHVRGGAGHLYVTSNAPTYDIRNFDTSLHLVHPGRSPTWRARLSRILSP
jgi:hypothetical protein